MADNVVSNANTTTGATWVAANFSFSGDSAYAPGCFVGLLSGSEGAWTYTLQVGGAGAVTAGTPRMTLASDDPAVASLAVLDDWDESDRAKVNLIVGQAGIAAGAGAVGATVPRVTLASDDPGVVSLALIDDAIYTDGTGTPSKGLAVMGTDGTNPQLVSVNASGHVNIADGGNAITVDGTVSAAQSGTWNITNISGTVSLPTGAATAAKQPALGTAGTASSDVITVQGIASMTALKVDGSAVTQPVSGTVSISGTPAVDTELAAAAALADNTANPTVTSLGAFAHWYDGSTWDRARGDSTDGLLVNLGANNDVTITGTVTVGSHAVTNAGTFAVQVDGAALTALQLIDNLVLAEDAAHGSGDPGVQALAVRNDSDASLCGTTGDYTPLQVDANGYLKVNIKAGAGSGGTASTDDAAFTAASGSGTPMMGFVTADSVDSGDVGVVGMLANRQLKVTLYDSAGSELAVGGGTQYDEDAAHSTGSKVTGCGIVRKDTAAQLAGTDGDYTLPISDANGKLWVNASGVTLTVDGSGVTQPISHAALTELAAAIDTEVQCDIVGALPAGTNAIGKLAANTGVDIGDVDVTSIVPGTGATNLGKAEDAAHTTGDVGVMALTVRQDTAAALGGTDADYQPLITDASGRLHVNVGNTVTVGSHAVTNAGTFAVQESGGALTALQLIDDAIIADDAAFTPATTKVMMAGFEFDDTTPDSVNEGDAGAARMSANRCIYVNVRDNAGNERGLNIDASGQLAVTLASSQTLATVTTVTTCSTVTTLTGGGVAHDGADSGNPIKVGARAALTLSDDTMVANGDRADNVADADGALIVRNAFPLGDLISERVSDTGGTSTAFTNFGATASTRSYITAICVYNSSATAGYVDFRDGTAGSVLFTVPLPAGGGAVVTLGGTPLFRTTANTALAYDVSGALSTVYISVTGYKSKV